jgi:hypothetical protein
MGYDTFISYSHAADARLAPALQTALHRFAKPRWKLRATNVFRDEISLAAAHDLTGSLASDDQPDFAGSLRTFTNGHIGRLCDTSKAGI